MGCGKHEAAKRPSVSSVASPRAVDRRHALLRSLPTTRFTGLLLKKVVQAKCSAPRGPKTEKAKKHDAPRGPKSERFDEQIVDVSIPQVLEEIMEVAQSTSSGAHLGASRGVFRHRCASAHPPGAHLCPRSQATRCGNKRQAAREVDGQT